MKCKKLIIFYSLLVISFLANAQQGPAIKASADKSRILIGEQFRLTVEAVWPSGSGFHGIKIDSIPHFEIIGTPLLDTLESDEGIVVKGVYTLTSFDSGHWVIPSFSLTRNVETDTIPVDVVFSDFDKAQDYHEIKDIMEVEAPGKKMKWVWYAGAGLLLLLAGIYFLFRKKKSPGLAKPERITDPYEEAMKQLKWLSQNKTEAKQFHATLTDIFRQYLFSKKGILTLQNTTDDLVAQLKKMNMDKAHFDQLTQSLILSDFVKFAKYNPTETDNTFCFETISGSIKIIEQPVS
jgi:LPXTG-motif cell wall-anchored protein